MVNMGHEPIAPVAYQPPEGKAGEVEATRVARMRRVAPDGLRGVQRPEFHFLLAPFRGHGTHMLDFVDHQLVPGTVLWVRPGQIQRWGEVERKPMTNVRRKTAEHVSQAWTSIPHVTQHDRADVTELDLLRKRFEKRAEEKGARLTATAIILKVAAAALRQFPQFNSSVDPERNEIVYKKYVHVGVAVDTERGLLVPVIRDADRKGILQLALERRTEGLRRLAQRSETHLGHLTPGRLVHPHDPHQDRMPYRRVVPVQRPGPRRAGVRTATRSAERRDAPWRPHSASGA